MKLLITLVVFITPFLGTTQSREAEVLKLLNAVRTNPQGFLTSYVNAYLEENELTKNSYAASLITDLKNCATMGELKTSKALNKVAQLHALDMGKRGTVGHTSSDGTTFSERLRKKAKAGGMIAENCDYGNEEPLDIVMALLIDDGIKSLGHRNNILEPTYRWIGIAIENHKTYRVNCVMDFAESLE
ncbi:MAG: CAP domain-containing protein [Cyclobacteriaceae bacterium]